MPARRLWCTPVVPPVVQHVHHEGTHNPGRFKIPGSGPGIPIGNPDRDLPINTPEWGSVGHQASAPLWKRKKNRKTLRVIPENRKKQEKIHEKK